MSNPAEIKTIDFHTAGEPFRIVLSGVAEIKGDSVYLGGRMRKLLLR